MRVVAISRSFSLINVVYGPVCRVKFSGVSFGMIPQNMRQNMLIAHECGCYYLIVIHTRYLSGLKQPWSNGENVFVALLWALPLDFISTCVSIISSIYFAL